VDVGGAASSSTTAAPPSGAPPAASAVTLVQSLRVPSAASGLSYEPQAVNGLTVIRHLSLVFSGCSEGDRPNVALFGLDCEDQVRIMTFPVLRAFAPAIVTNDLHFRVLYIDLFKPRCLIPIGPSCAGSKPSAAGKDAGKPPVPPGKPAKWRRLLYREAASHDGSASRDSLLASVAGGRQMYALEQSTAQREAREVLPLAWGVTMLPQHDGPEMRFRGRLVDLSGGTAAARRLAEGGEGVAAPPAFRARPHPSLPGPYASLYGNLWIGEVEVGAEAWAAEVPSGTPPRGVNTTGSHAVSRELKVSMKGPSLDTGGGGGWRLGDFTPSSDDTSCIGGSMMLYEKTIQIFQFKQTVMVWIVPVAFQVDLNADFRVDMGAAICITTRQVIASLVPQIRLRAAAMVGIDLKIIIGSIGVEADLLATALIPQLAIGLSTGGGMRAVFDLRLRMVPFAIRFFAQVQTFFIRISPPGICLDWVWPVYCPPIRFVLFEVAFDRIDILLFTISSGPYDTTPPKQGVIDSVTAQAGADAVVIKHDGFTDPDSDIDRYEAAVGLTPGGTDIFDFTNIRRSQNYPITGVLNAATGASRVPGDCTPVFITIRAYNGELQMTQVSSNVTLWDNSPPQVSDLRIMRSLDNMWSRDTCALTAPDGSCTRLVTQIFTSTTDSVAARFQVLEPCGPVNITQVLYAIGELAYVNFSYFNVTAEDGSLVLVRNESSGVLDADIWPSFVGPEERPLKLDVLQSWGEKEGRDVSRIALRRLACGVADGHCAERLQ
jgi:hypothetical protein